MGLDSSSVGVPAIRRARERIQILRPRNMLRGDWNCRQAKRISDFKYKRCRITLFYYLLSSNNKQPTRSRRTVVMTLKDCINLIRQKLDWEVAI